MNFEQQFYELLNKEKTKKIIYKILKEHCHKERTCYNQQEQLDEQQKEIDTKKATELLEQLEKAETEITEYKKIYKKLQEDLQDKEQQLKNAENACAELQKKCWQKDIEIQRIETELTEERKNADDVREQYSRLEKQMEELKAYFSDVISCYRRYSELPKEIRDSLSKVVCDKEPVMFIATGTNPDNLKRLWEYIKEILSDSQKETEIRILKEVFDYFFELYNQSLPAPIYKRDIVEAGDDYDDEYYTRSHTGASSGKVSEVLFRGYSSINTGKIICKSVVRI